MSDTSDLQIRVFFGYYVGLALLLASPMLFGVFALSTGAVQSVLAAGCMCALLLSAFNSRKLADAFNGHRASAVLSVVLVVFSFAPLAFYGVPYLSADAAFAVELAAGLVIGALFAMLYLLWYTIGAFLFTTSDDTHFRHIVLVPFGFSCVLMALSALMQPVFLPAICTASLVAPSALHRFLLSASAQGEEETHAAPSENGPEMPVGHWAYPVVFGVLAGMTTLFATKMMSPFTCVVIIAAAGIVTFAAIYLLMRVTKRAPSFYGVERVAVPVAFSCSLVAPLYGMGAIAAGVGLVLCSMGFSAFLAAHSMLVMRWCHRMRPQPIRHFAYGSFTIAIGFAVGAIASTAICMVPEGWRAQAIGLAYMALMLALTVANSASPYNSIGDFDTHGTNNRHGDKAGAGIWEVAVEVIANDNGLTPREKEIAGYLARGRNTRYISEKLVISEHTTKTHIYHIYKKTGVSSAQAFIDLVENEVNEIRDTVR